MPDWMPSLNPLDDSAARAHLDALIAAFRAKTASLTDDWTAGELSDDDWQRRMALEIRTLHAAAALLAVGSVDALTLELQRSVQLQTEAQLDALRQWSQGAQAPTPRRSPALLRARASLYGGAAHATYARLRVAALGLPDLPVYPTERSACFAHCFCYWAVTPLAGAGDFDCFWVRSVVESCPQCLQRAATFAPLRVRKGVVQLYNPAGLFL